MSLTARRLIFYLLTLLFLIVAPLTIVYTAGYRYSTKQRRLVKTGALSVRTAPDDATIILNGKLYKDRTPTLIANLLPGLYDIALEREGYHSWRKTLPVESEGTMFASPVMLLKVASPELLPSEPRGETMRAPPAGSDTPRHELRKETNEVWEIDPRTGAQRLITRLLEKIKTVTPLPQGGVLLLTLSDRIRAVELDLRDRQNSWDLASFDEIEKTALSEDGKTLYIFGTREGKRGTWKLELQ